MAPPIYDTSPDNTRGAEKEFNYDNINIVTVARALRNRILCKTIYNDGRPDGAYDLAKLFKFFSVEIECLHDLAQLLRLLASRKQSCLIRGIAKDDSIVAQQRIFRNDGPTEQTIIEQKLNWFAVDVDKFGDCTGDIRSDARTVLRALDLENTECLVIPSANYGIKSEIRLRLFFWNEFKVGYLALKSYFKQYDNVIDLSQFHPIQPIYTARPNFVGRTDPCKVLLAWIAGTDAFVHVPDHYFRNYGDNDELEWTAKQAKAFLDKVIRDLPRVDTGYRHNWLINKAIFIGKLVAQELLDGVEARDVLLSTVNWGWEGDFKKNAQTIDDGFKRGEIAMSRGK